MACAKVISDFEVLTADDLGRRRTWTDEEKIRIVEESLRGHRQGSATARRLGISRSLLTRWRAEYRSGRLGSGVPMFTAVTLASGAASPGITEASPPMAAAPAPEATIEIVLRNGRRMIVRESVAPAVLKRLLPVLEVS
ncbi:MAG: transposase [Rhodospirillaceae bacterium]|nr:transposase [Rhodospirillaceae bacterium]MCB9948964.1 transposase [Rhodospirillaceae bacterium]